MEFLKPEGFYCGCHWHLLISLQASFYYNPAFSNTCGFPVTGLDIGTLLCAKVKSVKKNLITLKCLLQAIKCQLNNHKHSVRKEQEKKF